MKYERQNTFHMTLRPGPGSFVTVVVTVTGITTMPVDEPRMI
jgi:hypothetical protein